MIGFKFFLLIATFVGVVLSNKILVSPIVSNYGDWGHWEHCLAGEYAVGFQLRTEPWLGPLADDTSLNGIRLMCGKPGEEANAGSHAISSSVGPWGRWGTILSCRGVATGFQLKSETPVQFDNTAANNLRTFCSGSESFLEGDGERFGDWTASQHCDHQQAFCGIQVQLQAFQDGVSDDTTLNNLKVECCDVESPGSSCTPADEIQFLVRCDNRHGTTPVNCVYQYDFGLSYEDIDATSQAYESLGFNLANVGGALRNNYQTNLGESPVTGYNWITAPPTTWNPEEGNQGNLQVAAGSMAEIYQIIGKCGLYYAKTNSFKEIVTNKQGIPFSRTFTRPVRK